MHNEKLDYLAYVVRLWPVNNRGVLVWRVSAESITGERHAFSDISSLLTFLRCETNRVSASGQQIDDKKENDSPEPSYIPDPA